MHPFSTLECQLREAFAEELSGSGIAGSLSHSDLVGLRRDLPLFPGKTFKSYLPLILIDVLHTHTNSASENEGAEALIQYLSMGGYVEHKSDAILFGEGDVQDMANAVKLCDRRKEHIFDALSRDQAEAVYVWLRATKDWDDFYYCREEQTAAEEYWSARARGER